MPNKINEFTPIINSREKNCLSYIFFINLFVFLMKNNKINQLKVNVLKW